MLARYWSITSTPPASRRPRRSPSRRSRSSPSRRGTPRAPARARTPTREESRHEEGRRASDGAHRLHSVVGYRRALLRHPRPRSERQARRSSTSSSSPAGRSRRASRAGRSTSTSCRPRAQLSVRVDGQVVDLTTEGAPPELGAVASGHRSYVRVESERMRAAEQAKKTDGGRRRQDGQEPDARARRQGARGQGRRVEVGHGLVVLEAMKMENEVRAARRRAPSPRCTWRPAPRSRGTPSSLRSPSEALDARDARAAARPARARPDADREARERSTRCSGSTSGSSATTPPAAPRRATRCASSSCSSATPSREGRTRSSPAAASSPTMRARPRSPARRSGWRASCCCGSKDPPPRCSRATATCCSTASRGPRSASSRTRTTRSAGP